MSYGNTWTEIDLNKKSNTLIVGKNGSGKSTFLDAISYALFGKAYRNINKPQLINTITGKGMVVEIEFSIGKKKYKIIRGIKPNIFDIYIDGELLKQDSLIKDYQAFLENNILKINHKSFSQIVVLGSSNYVPFMQLPSNARRSIIEDLLDLQVFSTMNVLLKEKVNTNKDDLTAIEYEAQMIQSNLDLHNEHLKSVRSDIKDEKLKLKEKIQEEKKKLKVVTAELKGEYESLHRCKKELEKFEIVEVEIAKIKVAIEKLDKARQKSQKEIDFYNISCKCNTCKQQIDEKFKEQAIESAKNTISSIDKNEKIGKNKIEKLKTKLDSQSTWQAEHKNHKDAIPRLELDINTKQHLIEAYEVNLANLDKKIEAIDTSKKEQFEADLRKSRENKQRLIEQKEVLTVASQLLKDGGIKTLIIKQYIPVMNKIINQYLNHMNLFIEFNLDENFNEVIRSRHRDEFSYESFSQGEKARIDLAILFSWRAIAKMRNTASTNLLIFDEIFDGALDNDGTDDFMKILNTIVGDTNVFIISHKVDNISDRFENVLKFDKIKNFSRLERLN